MAWGTVLKTFAKGAAKKVASGAKKVKGKGKKMAENFMASRKKKRAIVVREKSTSIVQSLGGDIVKQDSSIKKPKSGSSSLDRIDSALLDIINTLKSRRKLMLAQSRRDRVQSNKEKKGKREGLLEKMKKGGKKMLGNVKKAASGWWEKLQTFLLMTMLGALVKSIVDNWKLIKAQIDKVVKFVQDLWKFMEPVIIPLIEGLKWVVKQWTEMGSELMGLIKDKPKVEKETDKLSEDLKALEKTKKDVDGKFKEAEQGVRDLDKKTFDEVAIEAGLGSEVKDTKKGEVEGKTPPTPKRNRDEVTTDKTIKSDLSTITFDGKTYPRGMPGLGGYIPGDGKGGSTYEDGAVPVPETGPAVVHKGEVIIPAPIVKKVGGPMNVVNLMELGLPGLGGGGGGTDAITAKAKTKSLGKRGKDIGNLIARPFRDKTERDLRSKFATVSDIENIINMMSSSTEKIKKNPLKVISIMEGLANEFAPIGEQLPRIINETIKESKLGTVSNQVSSKMVEKMETTLSILKEQTDYEDPSGATIVISPSSQSQPSVRGGTGKTEVITIGPSMTGILNRYYGILLQKALK